MSHKLSLTSIIGLGAAMWLPLSVAAADPPPQSANFTYAGGDGSSLHEAVVIHARTEPDGIRAERAWIKEHWSGARPGVQALMMNDGRRYDSLTIIDASGKKHTLYFDITEFFGKLWEAAI
jgi:hypothetical protein